MKKYKKQNTINGIQIRIEVEEVNGVWRINAFAGSPFPITSINNEISGKWHVGSSSCLPADAEKAVAHHEATSMAFNEMNIIICELGV